MWGEIMKRIIGIILAAILLFTLTAPVFAAADEKEEAAEKGTSENPYKWDEIPPKWIKAVKKDDKITAYIVTVPDEKKASFKVSGTTYASLRYKKNMNDKYSDPIDLTEKKLKTIKNVSVLRVTLRKATLSSGDKPSNSATPINAKDFYFGWFDVITEDGVKAAIPNVIMRFHGTVDMIDPGDFTNIVLTRDGIPAENNISFKGRVDRFKWGYEDVTDFYFAFDYEIREPGNYGMTGKYKGIDFTVYNKIIEKPFTNGNPANPNNMSSVGWVFYPDVNGAPKNISEVSFNFNGKQQTFNASDLSELALTLNGKKINFTFQNQVFRYLEENGSGGADTSFCLLFTDPLVDSGKYILTGKYRGTPFKAQSIAIP